MATETVANNQLLIDDDIYSAMLKEALQDELIAMQWVDWLNDFNQGAHTYRIPSIGEAVTDDYVEGDAIKFRPFDKGEFTMVIDKHKTSGHSISDIAMEDVDYATQLVSKIPSSELRAIMKAVETDIFKLQNKQTAADTNLLNGEKHRFVGTGASNTIAVEDFMRANLALNKANVSSRNRIAVVDPSVEYTLSTLTNLTSVSNNPMWEGVVAEGMTSGMRFTKNVYGWDIYVSNYLDTLDGETLETVDTTGFKANMFFSADGEENPFKGAWARMPRFKSWRDEDREETKYATSSRYGLDLYRSESLVVIPTYTSV